MTLTYSQFVMLKNAVGMWRAGQMSSIDFADEIVEILGL